jgi:hypothetical protein
MKLILSFVILMGITCFSFAQNNPKHAGIFSFSFGEVNGILDSSANNPKASEINPNELCIKYIRSKEEVYDNIKLNLKHKLNDVSTFATYEGNPSKIFMRIFSTANVGTQIEIQFGKRGEIAYPDGVHSQYQGHTKKQNEWEIVEFLFAQIPNGSMVNNNEIDQITILFAPKTETNTVFYFDGLEASGNVSK